MKVTLEPQKDPVPWVSLAFTCLRELLTHNAFPRERAPCRKWTVSREKKENLTWVVVLVYVRVSSQREAEARRHGLRGPHSLQNLGSLGV